MSKDKKKSNEQNNEVVENQGVQELNEEEMNQVSGGAIGDKPTASTTDGPPNAYRML